MLIDKPTRITSTSATLLDQIVTNDICNHIKSGIGICVISDHLAVFSVIPVLCRRMDSVKAIGDMSHFDTEQFLEELCYEMSIILKNKSSSGNELFRNFRNKLINIILVDKNALFEKATRWELKLASKPWLTKDLQKQIRFKKTLLKQLIKNQNEECYKHYQTYRIQLNRLIQQSKVLYYQNLIDENNGIVTLKKHRK